MECKDVEHLADMLRIVREDFEDEWVHVTYPDAMMMFSRVMRELTDDDYPCDKDGHVYE